MPPIIVPNITRQNITINRQTSRNSLQYSLHSAFNFSDNSNDSEPSSSTQSEEFTQTDIFPTFSIKTNCLKSISEHQRKAEHISDRYVNEYMIRIGIL